MKQKKSFAIAFLIATTAIFSPNLVGQMNVEMPKNTPKQSSAPTKGSSNSNRSNSSESSRNTSGSQNSNPQVLPIFIPVPINNRGGNSSIEMPTDNSNLTQPTQQEINTYYSQQKKNIKNSLRFMESPLQEFIVEDVSQSFEIQGQKGFKLYFPAYAFANKNGEVITGSVKITLQEFTDFTEFAASNLSTQTTSGDILESAGMIQIDAFSGNEKLQLQSGAQYYIQSPPTYNGSNFDTYYGSGDDNILWTTELPKIEEIKTEKVKDGYTIALANSQVSVNGQSNSLYLQKNGILLSEYINGKLKMSDSDRSKILKAGIPFTYYITLNSFGKIKKVRAANESYSTESLITPLHKQILLALESAPALSTENTSLQLNQEIPLVFATTEFYTNKIIVGNEVRVQSETLPKPAPENVNNVMLSSSNLGLINADRLAGNRGTDTTHFSFQDADAIVYVIFKNQNSFLQANGKNGQYFITGAQPEQEMHVISILYDIQGNTYMTRKDIEFKKQNIQFTERQTYDEQTFKAWLQECRKLYPKQ